MGFVGGDRWFVPLLIIGVFGLLGVLSVTLSTSVRSRVVVICFLAFFPRILEKAPWTLAFVPGVGINSVWEYSALLSISEGTELPRNFTRGSCLIGVGSTPEGRGSGEAFSRFSDSMLDFSSGAAVWEIGEVLVAVA